MIPTVNTVVADRIRALEEELAQAQLQRDAFAGLVQAIMQNAGSLIASLVSLLPAEDQPMALAAMDRWGEQINKVLDNVQQTTTMDGLRDLVARAEAEGEIPDAPKQP